MHRRFLLPSSLNLHFTIWMCAAYVLDWRLPDLPALAHPPRVSSLATGNSAKCTWRLIERKSSALPLLLPSLLCTSVSRESSCTCGALPPSRRSRLFFFIRTEDGGGVCQGRTHSFLMQIWLKRWFRDFFRYMIGHYSTSVSSRSNLWIP